MKINRLFLIFIVFASTQILAQQYRAYQTQSPTASQYSTDARAYPRTAPVGQPLRSNQPGRVPLDYEGNEYSKRLPTEHFTFDPEEDLRRRR